MMDIINGVTESAKARVSQLNDQIADFPESVRKAMELADRFDYVTADEYVIPNPDQPNVILRHDRSGTAFVYSPL